MKKRMYFGLLLAILILAASAFAVSAAEEGTYCPHCDTVVTDWTEWTATASGSHSQTTGGHFYLSKDLTGMSGRYGINSGSETVVLDLRGHAIESTNNRAFFVSGGTLAIMDSVGGGTVTGARDGDGSLYVAAGAKIDMYGGTTKTSRTSVTSSTGCGSVLYVLKGGEFNLYGGTLDGSAITTRNTMSGTACVKGTLNIYGGTISGGNSTNGGNVYLDGGTLYMTGGTITGGQAVNGGNIYTKNAATVTIAGDATVTKGHATSTGGLGGNLCVNGGSTVNLNGGKITDGISDARGGNISNGGANTYNITSGEMTGGSAGTDGANMFVNNGSVSLNISGGYIDGGMDIRLTPNIHLSGDPVITDKNGGLVLSLGTTHAKIQPGVFTEGAGIAVSANGTFTDALTDAESYLQYIKAGSRALTLSVEDSKLTAAVICPHCDQAVTWTAWEDVISTSHKRTEGGHFYLTANVSGTGRYQIAGGDVVLDLRGYNITSTTDRVFYVSGGALAIVDSVGTGVMLGNRNGDGIIRVDSAKIDMYGGTAMTSRTEIATGNNGSVLYVGNASATFTLHDGTLYGGTVTTPTATSGTVYTKGIFCMKGGRVLNGYATTGGNIFVNPTGTFRMEGGLISGGEGTTAGGNVYASSGTVIVIDGTITGGLGGSGGGVYLYSAIGDLRGGTICDNAGTYGGNVHTAGNATKGGLNLGNCNICGGTATKSGADIYISGDGKLHVLKSFAGNASIGVNAAHLTDKTPGAALNTALDSAEGWFPGILTLESISGTPQLLGSDGKTGLYIAGTALVDADHDLTWYADNASAIANYGNSVCILPAAGALELKGGSYVVDLGGKDLNITGTGKVLCFDSSNEDFATYGTATINGPALQNSTMTQIDGKDYVTLNESGTYSFHRLEMSITGVSLRPSAAGFYYTSSWKMDEKLVSGLAQFGVAVSTFGAPSLELMAQEQMLWTAFDGASLENGVSITGALIENVFKSGEKYNDVRGRTSVFGATYLVLGDGTVLIGESIHYSLYDIMQLLDKNADTQNTDTLNSFYAQWKDVLSSWQLENIGKTLLEKNGISGILGDVLYETDFEADTAGQLPTGWSAGLYGGSDTSGTSFGWTGNGGSFTAQVAELEGYGKVYLFQSSNADAFTAMPAINTADYLYEAELYIMRKGGIGLANNLYAPTYDATGVLFTSMYPGTTNACKYTYKGVPANKSTQWEVSENPAVGEIVKLQILSLGGKNYIFNKGNIVAVCDSRAGGTGVDHPGLYACGGGAYVLSVKVTEILSAQVNIDSAMLGLGENSALMALDLSLATAQPFYRYYAQGKFTDLQFGAMVLVSDTDVSATLDDTVSGVSRQFFSMDAITVTPDALTLTAEFAVPAQNYEKWYCIRPFVLVDGTCIYSEGRAYMPVNLANSAYHNAPNEETKALVEKEFGSYAGFLADENTKTLTFTLFSDFHYKAGMYPATISDLNTIMQRAEDSGSAFVLSAGDFTNDAMGSPELFEAFLNYTTGEGTVLPAYNIYGNHELEAGNTMAFMTPLLTNDANVVWGTADGSYDENIGYYCFEKEGFRIICLDSQYSYNPTSGVWEHNYSGSSGWPSGNTLGGSLGPSQLAWLEAVLMDAAEKDIPCIVVAHDGFSGLGWATTSPDSETIRGLYRKANDANSGTVLMSINGHIHTNHQGWNDGVFYFDTNTVRNNWWQETAVDHYTDEHTFMYEEYDEEGNLIATYEKPLNSLTMGAKTWFSADPLSCVITLSADGMVQVDGAQSDWVYGIAPDTSTDGVMCEITSGTFWDCDRCGHILTKEDSSCSNVHCNN